MGVPEDNTAEATNGNVTMPFLKGLIDKIAERRPDISPSQQKDANAIHAHSYAAALSARLTESPPRDRLQTLSDSIREAQEDIIPIDHPQKEIMMEMQTVDFILLEMVVTDYELLEQDEPFILDLITTVKTAYEEGLTYIEEDTKGFDSEQIEMANRVLSRLNNTLRKDESRGSDTRTTIGLEFELEEIKKLIHEGKLPEDFDIDAYVAAVDSVQGLGLPVAYDAQRELVMPPSISSVHQLRTLLTLRKIGLILEEQKNYVHVNVGGIEDPDEVLEDILLLHLAMKSSGTYAFYSEELELTEDSWFSVNASAKKPFYEGYLKEVVPTGFPFVIRPNGVVEFRGLVPSQSSFSTMAKGLRTFDYLTDALREYSIWKKSGTNEAPNEVAQSWIDYRNETFEQLQGLFTSQGDNDRLKNINIRQTIGNWASYFRLIHKIGGFFKDLPEGYTEEVIMQRNLAVESDPEIQRMIEDFISNLENDNYFNSFEGNREGGLQHALGFYGHYINFSWLTAQSMRLAQKEDGGESLYSAARKLRTKLKARKPLAAAA